LYISRNASNLICLFQHRQLKRDAIRSRYFDIRKLFGMFHMDNNSSIASAIGRTGRDPREHNGVATVVSPVHFSYIMRNIAHGHGSERQGSSAVDAAVTSLHTCL
jgi:hypothetical protein